MIYTSCGIVMDLMIECMIDTSFYFARNKFLSCKFNQILPLLNKLYRSNSCDWSFCSKALTYITECWIGFNQSRFPTLHPLVKHAPICNISHLSDTYMKTYKTGSSLIYMIYSATKCYLNWWRLNLSSHWQNGCHFADDIFKRIFLNEIFWFFTKMSLKFVPQGPIDNNLALDGVE